MIASGQPWLISAVLLGTALALLLAEALFPRRHRSLPVARRWPNTRRRPWKAEFPARRSSNSM